MNALNALAYRRLGLACVIGAAILAYGSLYLICRAVA